MDDDLLKEFINECREHLVTIETDLLTLEEGGVNIDEPLVNKVFRAAHSIKGGSGFFGLNNVKELSHKAETVLDMIRSRKMVPNSEVTNILLAAFDKLRELINNTETSDQADIGDLLVALTGLASSYLPPEQKASLNSFVDFPAPCSGGKITLPQTDVDRARAAGLYIYWVDCDLIHDVEEKGQTVLSLFSTLSLVADVLDCAVDFEAVGTLDGPACNRIPLRLVVGTVLEPDMAGGLFDTIDESRIHLLMDPHAEIAPAVAAPAPIIHAPAAPEPVAAPAPAPVAAPVFTPEHVEPAAVRSAETASTSSAGADETLRINVTLLEALMNLAGELVLSRNQLRAAVSQDDRQMLASADQRINQVTSELQDVIMQTRLQPIGNVFSKFPRVVRDLSRTLGKEITLEILGKDVALDKTMIEGLSDPLTHMVRNAVDHGIESASERVSAGKSAAGTVRIDARHEAGQVVVEISDDGKGLHPDRIAESAVRKGLISAEKAQALSDPDKQALIFMPGLSTAQVISDVSGRGVGMDVVKTNLDRLGGQVEIDSAPGRGSTFRIKLPLTLAIIPSLIVSMDQERFAIPQANIEELLRLRAEEVQHRIEIVGDSEVLLLRERMIPLARLSEVIGSVPTFLDPTTERTEFDRRSRLADRRSRQYGWEDSGGTPDGAAVEQRRGDKGRRRARTSTLEIAVLNTGTLTFGLVVGAFHATEEVVVKPLGRRFKQLREYSGATILGDGAVALILDASGIALKAELSSVSGTARASELQAEAESQRMQDVHSFLLFQNGPSESCALPLDVVQRIERIQSSQIERLGSHRTMQYRGGSLPLISLSDAASFTPLDDVPDPVVFVSSVHGREIGLMGTMPVDVVETRVVIDQSTHRQTGIAGSAIVNGKTTFMADLHELIDVLHPEWGDHSRSTRAKSTAAAVAAGETILLAEDSDFFRAQVKRYLEEDGLKVLDAPDGEAAWELLLENLDTVTVVVSDIEMPRLTGLGLATRIRNDARTSDLPIIAVTSLAGEEDAARGLAAGITEYQVKLDRETLLSRVHYMMNRQRSAKQR